MRFNGDQRRVTEGPFAETKEVIAGFMIIQAKSLAEAIEWVKRAPNLTPDLETEVEIRKLMDAEDFGEAFTPNAEVAKVKY
ncbi:MAG: YciI family protein [Gemmatimonadaceae bacterium]